VGGGAAIGHVNRVVPLTDTVVQSIGKTIYKNGEVNDLNENEMLTLCDALVPYYPPNDEEIAAGLVLREWIEAQKVRQTAGLALKELRDLAGSAVDSWARMMQQWHYEARERGERRYYEEHRYHEERHPDMDEEMLYKELSYQFKAGDPRAMIAALGRLVEQAVRRNQAPVPAMPPPQVAVPPELVAASKEFADKTEEKLGAYIDRVAKAKQCIARYLYRVVAAEKIIPGK